VYLCYIDESGTSDVPGNTSHFVLAGISIPIWHWNTCDREIETLKRRIGLQDAEIHVAWMLRKYPEQVRIAGFDALTFEQRRSEVERARRQELLRLQSLNNHKLYQQTKKNFLKTQDYVHLTLDERRAFILEVASCVGGWGFARLFAECVDKIHFDPRRSVRTIDEQAFEQIVSRFEQYLQSTPIGGEPARRNHGLLIHDNNQTVADKHTKLMKSFLRTGTFWTRVESIIETPLFVDSQLTSMVQIADLCAYGLRRYLENNETDIFNEIFKRAHRRNEIAVGVRHFTNVACTCEICAAHRPAVTQTSCEAPTKTDSAPSNPNP
jgi:hypothetical protein